MDKITKQNALNAHTWVGVFLSVLLFLVCLSGTVAVFHLEFERWEQPHIEEMKNVSPDVVEKAMDTFLAEAIAANRMRASACADLLAHDAVESTPADGTAA
ncbi:MAG: PepSY-associated TM helix domain-containing protein, partial [Pseudomonadota bacterium]|nr:PepSY-associated TM helix domain-containing protein [Pseudomonadota bacterium]